MDCMWLVPLTLRQSGPIGPMTIRLPNVQTMCVPPRQCHACPRPKTHDSYTNPEFDSCQNDFPTNTIKSVLAPCAIFSFPAKGKYFLRSVELLLTHQPQSVRETYLIRPRESSHVNQTARVQRIFCLRLQQSPAIHVGVMFQPTPVFP